MRDKFAKSNTVNLSFQEMFLRLKNNKIKWAEKKYLHK